MLLPSTHSIIVQCVSNLTDCCNVTDKLQHYDLGFKNNMKKYGQPKPPEYDLRKVTSPVVLYYSENDRVVDRGVRHRTIIIINTY